MSLFIMHAHKTGQDFILSDAYLTDMIINFMIAGRDTTSCTLTNIFKMLATNPAAEARAVAEARAALPGRDSKPTYAACVKNMPYADACFNESLRMYPPVGNDGRFAVKVRGGQERGEGEEGSEERGVWETTMCSSTNNNLLSSFLQSPLS